MFWDFCDFRFRHSRWHTYGYTYEYGMWAARVWYRYNTYRSLLYVRQNGRWETPNQHSAGVCERTYRTVLQYVYCTIRYTAPEMYRTGSYGVSRGGTLAALELRLTRISVSPPAFSIDFRGFTIFRMTNARACYCLIADHVET